LTCSVDCRLSTSLTNRPKAHRPDKKKRNQEPEQPEPTTMSSLPQLADRLFLTDGGIETTLIFHEGLELPFFAAFHLLREPQGRAALVRYYERYISIAQSDRLGFI